MEIRTLARRPYTERHHDRLKEPGLQVRTQPAVQVMERLQSKPLAVHGDKLPNEGHDRSVGEAPHRPANLAAV